MIVNLDENNISAGYYAYVKDGAVRKYTLRGVCAELPFVVVSLEYKLARPFYYRAVRRVVRKALAVFDLYGHGDIRMTELLKACKEYGIHLENLLCPDERLKLDSVGKKVDLIVLDYLENKVLDDVAMELDGNSDELSEDARAEATQAVRQFAALAAAKINASVKVDSEDVQVVKEVERSFREENLRAAVGQLNAYSSALKELTS